MCLLRLPAVRSVAALAVFSAAAIATVVPRMSLEEVAGRSERIVHARVVRSWSGWDRTRSFIWTHYELAVSEWLRGDAGARFVVSEPGGVVDGVGMQIAGTPKFDLGDEIVVFAYKTPIEYWRVQGYTQGAYRVDAGPGGLKIVRSATADGITILGADPSSATSAVQKEPSTLSDFKARVRVILDAQEVK